MPAKNFVLLTIDDMRSLDDWGHFSDLVVAPNLARLQALGTTFERAITQVPICNPSRASVLTGQEPSRTGVLDNDTPWHQTIRAEDTLPAVLRSAGAYVAMYGKNFHDGPASDAQRALLFDDYLGQSGGGSPSKVVKDGLHHSAPFASGRYTGTDLADEISTRAAVDFLQDKAPGLDQPFFLGVGITKPHLDWWAPSRYFDLYDPADIRSALQRSLKDGSIIPGGGEYSDVPSMTAPSPQHAAIAGNLDLWVDYIHAYLAAVSYADAKIGQVVDAVLSDPDLRETTAILLWSDNGQHMGDKDSWGKFTPWREATEVPLILVDPDAPGGQSARQVVSLSDIFPTVLGSMGIKAPARLDLDGESLLPIVQDIDIPWYDPDSGKGVALTTIFGTVSIRVDLPGGDDYRYTRYPDGTEEIYNLTRDPDEHVNRLHYRTGAGLTDADDAIHRQLDTIMDKTLTARGYILSEGRAVGTAAEELLVTGPGSGHVLEGGGGDDTYVLYRAARIVETAGGGTDGVFVRGSAAANFVTPENVEIVHTARNATGNDAANRIFGSAGDNVLSGGRGNDYLDASKGKDTLLGGTGDDTLRGMEGKDRLTGGAGRDILDGGTSNDTFVFLDAAESGPAAPDRILGFDGAGKAAGDRIDLSAIDANTGTAGNQAFVFGGTGAGHVWIEERGGVTEVLANTGGDAAPEFRLAIEDGATVAAAYVAQDFLL